MFDSVGWGEIVVLAVAGLFILGPERLPSAAAWLGRTIRQIRDYASSARNSLRTELGPEFEELRKPLEELNELRRFNPRTAVRRTLLDDGLSSGKNGATRVSPPPRPASSPTERLTPGERPPIDPDAT